MSYFFYGFWFLAALSTVLAQKYTIYPLSIEKCKVERGDEWKYEVALIEENGGDDYHFTFTGDLTEDLDLDKCSYKADTNMMTGLQSVWIADSFGKDACEALENAITKPWERLKKDFNLTGCRIPKGKYEIKSMKMNKEDVEMDIPSNGQFKVEVHVACNDIERACFEVIALIDE